MTGFGVLLALLLSAPGAPPGLGWAIGSWPMQSEGRDAPDGFRKRVEGAVARRLQPDQRGCYLYALEDLDGDGRDELLVFVTAFGQCGTAGCELTVFRWDGRHARRVSTTGLVRNVYLVPWNGKGMRPLYIEKWGEQLIKMRATDGRYPVLAEVQPWNVVGTVPEGIRKVTWIRARCCASEAAATAFFSGR